jgi:two-component system, OmpR family, manganese sensing response regulator
MKILLLEDDLEQREPIEAALTESGHRVDGVGTQHQAQCFLEFTVYDLLIIDWMLPQGSGLELCTWYRQQGKQNPILILTAKDTTTDKVRGLDAGADDYLVKPIDIMELLARVRALGRRSPLWQGNQISLGDLKFDPNNLVVQRQEKTVKLSKREAQLLEYFLRHPYQVLSRIQLEELLWQWDSEPESNALTTQIRRLRQRLRDLDADRWIETVYGLGYRIKPL